MQNKAGKKIIETRLSRLQLKEEKAPAVERIVFCVFSQQPAANSSARASFLAKINLKRAARLLCVRRCDFQIETKF
jgi:hypothetical protein